MLSAFTNSLKIPELRQKIFFTLALLFIARVGANIPLPGMNVGPIREFMADQASASGGLVGLYSRHVAPRALQQNPQQLRPRLVGSRLHGPLQQVRLGGTARYGSPALAEAAVTARGLPGPGHEQVICCSGVQHLSSAGTDAGRCHLCS